MLSKISALTAAVTAVLNLAVLFGLDWTADQIAGINVAIIAIGTCVHIWMNPNVPYVGIKSDDPPKSE